MQMKDKIIDTVRQFLLDKPEELAVIFISLGGKRKPICLVNSKKWLYFPDKPTGIVIKYSADHRNLHDRDIYNKFVTSDTFKGYSHSKYGYDGSTFLKYFEIGDESIFDELKSILCDISALVDIKSCSVEKSSTHSDELHSS
jgi:hypothetical protein